VIEQALFTWLPIALLIWTLEWLILGRFSQ